MQVKIVEYQHKYKTYKEYLQMYNFSNNQLVCTPNEIKYYKVFVGKGNNSIVVETAFKKRL